MHRVNWDDLKFVLAVAESGSVAGAARALSVNHATVLRRVTAFETASGKEVFERTAQGYRLRKDRADVIEAAREAAEAMRAVERMLSGQDGCASRELRVTSVDSLCAALLPALLAEVEAQVAPDRITLLCSNAHLDMARLQAEVTVRPTLALPEDMAGESPGALRFCVYATPGAPERWLGLAGALARSGPARWMASELPLAWIGPGADSFVVLRELARRGMGRVVLPRVLGDGAPGLEPLEGLLPEMPVPVWVACHRDIAGQPRIARLVGALTAALRRQARSGECLGLGEGLRG